jgi:cysteine desulfurase
VGATEHKAVLDVAEWLAGHRGIEVAVAPVTSDGTIDLAALAELVTDQTFAVCVMAANNETGAISPLGPLAAIAHDSGAAFVCDATQHVGKLPIALDMVDFAAVSAHKMYAPQGVGALVVPARASTSFVPLLHGGGHERGFRSGTLNLPGIAGFGEAAVIAGKHLPDEPERQRALRDELEAALLALGDVQVVAGAAERLPNTTNLRIAGVDADALIVACPQVAFSSGSACTAAVPSPSHVLTAMGLPTEHAEQCIRLSVGRFTSTEDVQRGAKDISSAANHLRNLGAS